MIRLNPDKVLAAYGVAGLILVILLHVLAYATVAYFAYLKYHHQPVEWSWIWRLAQGMVPTMMVGMTTVLYLAAAANGEQPVEIGFIALQIVVFCALYCCWLPFVRQTLRVLHA